MTGWAPSALLVKCPDGWNMTGDLGMKVEGIGHHPSPDACRGASEPDLLV